MLMFSTILRSMSHNVIQIWKVINELYIITGKWETQNTYKIAHPRIWSMFQSAVYGMGSLFRIVKTVAVERRKTVLIRVCPRS